MILGSWQNCIQHLTRAWVAIFLLEGAEKGLRDNSSRLLQHLKASGCKVAICAAWFNQAPACRKYHQSIYGTQHTYLQMKRRPDK